MAGAEGVNLFEILMSVILAIVGWLLTNAWAEIKELKSTLANEAKDIRGNMADIKEEHHRFQILVLQSFVKSESFEKTEARIFQALDRIEHMISKKADKEPP